MHKLCLHYILAIFILPVYVSEGVDYDLRK